MAKQLTEEKLSPEETLRTIAAMTDADDPNSHRSDDPESCLDSVHYQAQKAIEGIKQEQSDLQQTRQDHAAFLRKLKKMLGYTNWPKIEGDFLDGVAKLIEARIK